ncbi:MAG: ribbon-helix-helix domain-containing protein [Bacteroidetes bacterium]|nr:ribbon-helix-helix domain-containing protein [Bacteroidota bacterium]
MRGTQIALLEVKKTTFTLPRDLYKKLKVESAKREVEMSSIVTEALRKFLPEEDGRS